MNYRFSILVLAVMIQMSTCESTAADVAIRVSIGFGGANIPPDFSYNLSETEGGIIYELVSETKIIARDRLVWETDLRKLSGEIVEDFAKTVASGNSGRPAQNAEQVQISIRIDRDNIRTAVSVAGSYQDLTTFVGRTHSIRKILRDLSAGKPKKYDLWGSVGPSSQAFTESVKDEPTRQPKQVMPGMPTSRPFGMIVTEQLLGY